MADEKDTGFKVSDRRMFNPDGSPRQPDPEPESEKAEPGGPPQVANESSADSDKVVSLPSPAESRRQTERGEPGASTAGRGSGPAGAPRPSEPLRDMSRGPAEEPEH